MVRKMKNKLKKIFKTCYHLLGLICDLLARFIPGWLFMVGLHWLEQPERNYLAIVVPFAWAFALAIFDVILDKKRDERIKKLAFYEGYNAGCKQMITALGLKEKNDNTQT